jgi:hypothetical protein
VIDEYLELKSPVAKAYFLSLSKVILDRLYIVDDDLTFRDLRASIEKLPQDIRYRLKSVLDQKKINNCQIDNEVVQTPEVQDERLSKKTNDFIDMFVVGENEGLETYGIASGTEGTVIDGVPYVCGTLIQFCERVTSFENSGEIKPNINRSTIWPRLFQRDVENAPFVSIVDRYFMKTLGNGRIDNGCKWMLEQIDFHAKYAKSLRIFSDLSEDVDTSRIGHIIRSSKMAERIEIYNIDTSVWKSQQHQRYIRYGKRGLLYLDPGFDALTETTKKSITYIKKSDQKDLLERQSWENSFSVKSKMVLLG